MILFVLGLVLAGQPVAGRLHGRVSDPSGAVLAGVPVVLSSAGGQVVETKTDRQGRYAIDRLAPGDYVVLISAAGFADARVPIVVLGGGQDQRLDVTLTIAAQRQTIDVQAPAAGRSLDPGSNASATIIKGNDLDALSDDANELEAQLRALAGPGAGASGGQIFVDGFSGGRLPPKSAIQQIRINQNPYSAEFDALGAGRVEIITKPGLQTVHGRFLFDGSASALNSRNPFVSEKPPQHSGFLAGSVGGPLGSAAAFAVDGEAQDNRETAPINAVVLDAALNPTAFNAAVPDPHTLVVLTPRLDLQPARANTLSIRYGFQDDRERASGVGQVSLASQAVDVRKTEHDLRATDLEILGPKVFNDARFEYRAYEVSKDPSSEDPQILVPGAFVGGGSAVGRGRMRQRHVEIHDYVSIAAGSQMVRMGGRLRATSTADDTRQNFNGVFMFPSLDVFRATERGLARGLTPDQIRAAGGGASQFTLVTGTPAVSDTAVDAGLFVQDDWRVRPNLTVSGGIRYETQNDIAVRPDFAPRLGVAWGVGRAKKGAAPPWVVRAGGGLFYDRVPQTLALQAERLDGVRTQQFVVGAPDFFPAVPSAAALTAAQIAPAVYRLDSSLRAPTTTQTGLTIERGIGKASTISVGYLFSHGSRQLLSRNVNAPAPGAVPATPAYQFEAIGRFNQHQFTTNFNLHPGSWISFNGYYVLSSARGNSAGAASFPSNPLDLDADYGRAAFDVRHRLAMFAGIDLPGFRVVSFVTASSGQPFDITVGRDLNGDSIFNDRPAFATDASKPSVVVTPFGAFDTAPTAGQTIVPRNFGVGPADVSVNLRVTKPFVVREHDTIRLDLVVSNVLNRVNAALPIGNLGSPLFGRSTGLANTLSPGANRRVHLQLQFLF